MNLLDTIHGHQDLAALSPKGRKELCEEIRGFLVDHVAKTGGHLASNLGVVELTVAIETVFDTAKDRLVFDVGHQSYVHKILTDRKEGFDRLRQFGGIAGFPKPSESDTDAFVAGHASNSVSVALGMARARSRRGEHYNVLALIGDGATTGGLCYEGLNDAGDSGEPLIVILNDNEMSIARNVGGVAQHLSRLRTRSGYFGLKKAYRTFVIKIPGGRAIYKVTHGIKTWLKKSLLGTTIFEDMGFTYLGPVDGHDIEHLIYLLGVARAIKSPVLLHVITTKGKGYAPAQENPSQFHGIGKFDPQTGQPLGQAKPTFSQAFGETMVELAKKHENLCAITAAMPSGTGLTQFQKEYPGRTYDVGIAEGHAVSMAGGLAKCGMIPVFAVYSTFLQRSYDMILQDVAMLNLHVVFAVDRAGLVGEDGETHHGVFDIGYLQQVPGITIFCPSTTMELRQMLVEAVEACDGPVAVRYPRGGDGAYTQLPDGSVVRQGRDLTMVTYGTMINQVMEAADLLAQEGTEAEILRLRQIKPLDMAPILDSVRKTGRLLVVEETMEIASVGSRIVEKLATAGVRCNVALMNLGDAFVPHGSMKELYESLNLDAGSIAARGREVLANES